MPEIRVRDLSNCTLNGVPLEKVIVEETVREFKSVHQKAVSELSYAKHVHISTRRTGNISGARSGRGRVIFSRQMAVGGAM